MEFETLKAMNDGIYPGLLTMMEVIALITVFLAINAFVISLVSIARLCLEETRQPALDRNKTAPKTGKFPSSTALTASQNSSLIASKPQSSTGANFIQ